VGVHQWVQQAAAGVLAETLDQHLLLLLLLLVAACR
jgi:hypothetical protein